jgi:GNAT superfamily N-acetyltransferase
MKGTGRRKHHSITLRRATPDDIELLVDLRIVMEKAVGMVEGNEEELARASRAYFREKVPSGEYVSFLAEAEDQVAGVGGIVLLRKPPHPRNLSGVEGYILNMYTHPDWRRRGIASRILDALLAEAREHHAALVWLRATETGRLVYEQHGFADDTHYMWRKL